MKTGSHHPEVGALAGHAWPPNHRSVRCAVAPSATTTPAIVRPWPQQPLRGTVTSSGQGRKCGLVRSVAIAVQPTCRADKQAITPDRGSGVDLFAEIVGL